MSTTDRFKKCNNCCASLYSVVRSAPKWLRRTVAWCEKDPKTTEKCYHLLPLVRTKWTEPQMWKHPLWHQCKLSDTFTELTYIKHKYGPRLNMEENLQVAVANIKPRKGLCCKHWAHQSLVVTKLLHCMCCHYAHVYISQLVCMYLPLSAMFFCL